MENIIEFFRLPEVLTVLSVITGVALGMRPQPGAGRARGIEAITVGLTTLTVAGAATEVPLAPSAIIVGFAVTTFLGDASRRRRARIESRGS